MRRLSAFSTVSQRLSCFPKHLPELVRVINRVYWNGQHRSVYGRIKALWMLEAMGVCLGKDFGQLVPNRQFAVPKLALPILNVGVGAGLVAHWGYQAWYCRDPYRCEGVGHMIELARHPTLAWLLGMPRVSPRLQRPDDFCSAAGSMNLDFNPVARIEYGIGRMRYLAFGTAFAEPYQCRGAAFAMDMLDGAPEGSEARKFLDLVFPESE